MSIHISPFAPMSGPGLGSNSQTSNSPFEDDPDARQMREQIAKDAGKTKRRRPAGPIGFAAMSPEQRREIASKGGREAHRRGTAHVWNEQTSKDANRKRVANMRAKKGGAA